MNDLADRLDRLEAANQLLKRVIALLALALVGLVAVGWKSPDGTVEAREIILRDKDGNQRAYLKVDDLGTPSFELTSAEGNSIRLSPGVDVKFPPSILLDDKIRRGELRSDGFEFGPADRGRDRLVSLYQRDLCFFDCDGNERVRISAKDRNGSVRVTDSSAQARVELSLAKDGYPTLGLYDPNEKPRLLLRLDKDWRSTIDGLDEKGELVWGIPK